MIKAYILYSGGDLSEVPSATEFMAKVRKVKGVKQAHILFGPHDGICYVEAKDLEELGEIIFTLSEFPGVGKLDTRIVYPR